MVKEKRSNTLGPLIAKLISRQALRQNELSRKVGMTPAQISTFLSGRKDIHSSNLVSILQVLGIDLAKILRSEVGGSTSVEEDVESQLKILPTVERNTLSDFVRVYHGRYSKEKILKSQKVDQHAE